VIGKTKGRNMKKDIQRACIHNGESMIMNGDGTREMKRKNVLRVQMAWNRIMGWETWGVQ
jgi:hypothetical protein